MKAEILKCYTLFTGLCNIRMYTAKNLNVACKHNFYKLKMLLFDSSRMSIDRHSPPPLPPPIKMQQIAHKKQTPKVCKKQAQKVCKSPPKTAQCRLPFHPPPF